MYPKCLVHCSKANENNTLCSIKEMGENLAEEVIEYIEQWCYGSLDRLSFIGHSLGGIIIRAALPYLKDYKDKMYSYMSLSAPHLGFLYGTGFLIKTGNFF